MKVLRIVTIVALLAVFSACEKAISDEEPKEEPGKETVKNDDNSGDEGKDNNDDKDGNGEEDTGKGDNGGKDDTPDGGTDDGSDDDTPIDDLPVDPGYDDKDDPYEEPDIDTGDDDDDNGSGISTGDIVSVTDFLTKDLPGGVYVEGYIVASCANNIKNADFDAPFKGASALLMADDPDERDTEKVISIQLKSGTKMREELNLEAHPENKGKRLRVFGYRTTYLYTTGMKDIASGMYELLD